MGFDVVALGELLVDFTPAGISARQNPFFQANPGGAPCNAPAMLAKLGDTAAFVGKVGDDIHGRRLAATLAELGIRTSGLAVSPMFHRSCAYPLALDSARASPNRYSMVP